MNQYCSYEYDGTDADGTKWYRCTVHDAIAPSEYAPCSEYIEESYMNTTCIQCGSDEDMMVIFTKHKICMKCTKKNHKEAMKG